MTTDFAVSSLRTPDKVRALPLLLSPDDLMQPPANPHQPMVHESDPKVAEVRQLLEDGFAGVILVGPPGTSKSWYAAAIAARLTDDDPTRMRSLQFHPGYQYDDFVEGYVPDPVEGFKPVSKHLLLLAEAAAHSPGKTHVLVIDEISRSDPARVFGEALTYIETTKRNIEFELPSGRRTKIPPEIVVVATMNSFDRGVEDVDAAFERRFAQIQMPPDAVVLDAFLAANQMDDDLRSRVVAFFRWLQRRRNRHCHIGHAYFLNVSDKPGLERLWKYQLAPLMERAFRLDDQGLAEVVDAWNRMVSDAASGTDAATEESDAAADPTD